METDITACEPVDVVPDGGRVDDAVRKSRWERRLAAWCEEWPKFREKLAAVPPRVWQGSAAERLAALADELGEHAPDKAQQLARVVDWLGWKLVIRALAATLLIEAGGGLWSVATKQRRTKGGVFYAALKDRSKRARRFLGGSGPAPARACAEPRPVYTWSDCRVMIHEARTAPGRISVTPKITIMGRPQRVVNKGGFVVMAMDFAGAPVLPKGLPVPPKSPTTYTVFVSTKQWRPVAEALSADEMDQAIIEGYPMYDEDLEGPVIWAQGATSKSLQRARREGMAAKDENAPAPRGRQVPARVAVTAPAAPALPVVESVPVARRRRIVDTRGHG